jgi:hypothetical protein
MSAQEKIWIDATETHMLCNQEKSDDVQYIRADLVPQWQDIETAPKDGTFILAFGNGVAIHNCHYIAEWSEGDGWICSYSDVDVTPSHWMPLPNPPEQAP